MRNVIKELRSIFMLQNRCYHLVVPKIWVKFNYPDLPQRDKVRVIYNSKVIVILPKEIDPVVEHLVSEFVRDF